VVDGKGDFGASVLRIVKDGGGMTGRHLRKLGLALATLGACAGIAIWASPLTAGTDDVIVGILEGLSPSQQQRLAEAYGSAAPAAVRIAFRRRGGQWEGFPSVIENQAQLATAVESFPPTAAWIVAFNGHERGRLRSQAPQRWLAYEDLGLEFIPAGEPVPGFNVPDATNQQGSLDHAMPRPRVLVSQPHTADPEEWRPAKASEAEEAAGRAAFRAQLAKDNPGLEVSDGEIQLLKTYGSAKGQAVMAFTILGKEPPPDEVPGPEWGPHWFVMDGTGAVRFLGADLLLIDAGDYDGDGRSEMVFRKSGYDYDGYTLFYDDFRRRAEFGWNYH
jgi:hypothetical protein